MSGDVIDFRRRRGYRRGYAAERPPEPPTVTGREPPHSREMEEGLLEAVLCRNGIEEVADILRPFHFRSDQRGTIYEIAVELFQARQPIDLKTTVEHAAATERLERCGGAEYIEHIVHEMSVTLNPIAYAEKIVEFWSKRQIIATCQRVAAEGYGDTGPYREWADASEQALFEIIHVPNKAKTTRLGPVVKDVFKRMYDAAERGERITGLPTGYDRLDTKMSGLWPGDLTLVAGRPGTGKTALVMNIAVNMACPRIVVDRHENGPDIERRLWGHGVAVFSLEMPKEQLVTRMLCSEARVDLGRLRNGYLQKDHWASLTEATTVLDGLPLWIDDTPAISVLDLRAKVRRLQAEYNKPVGAPTGERKIGLVVVDYVQLMRGREGATSREQEVGEISRGLKGLAKELEVPVIALSQLNRAVETRSTKDKRPQLSDLRETGSLEQDADNVLLLFREDYYDPQTPKKGIAEVNVAKQRNGPTGRVYLRFDASCTRFDNIALGDYPEEQEGQ